MKKKEQLQQLFDTFKKEAKEIIDSVDNDKPKVGEWWIIEGSIQYIKKIKSGAVYGAFISIDEVEYYNLDKETPSINDFNSLERKATPSEIEEGLRRVCEEMYPKGTKIKSLLWGECVCEGRPNPRWDGGQFWMYGNALFKDGKFAEIIEEEDMVVKDCVYIRKPPNVDEWRKSISEIEEEAEEDAKLRNCIEEAYQEFYASPRYMGSFLSREYEKVVLSAIKKAKKL